MITWADGIARALEYIEKNLTEDITIEDVAAQACVSAFHFQRIFGVLCGFTVGEYIRCRRLTCAAQELCAGSGRIIDLALKYGYDSQDSFTRAFARFHGVTPSAAREKGAQLRAFAPLRISLTLEGGTTMEYRIVEKPAITVEGVAGRFSEDTAYSRIPEFWDELMASGGPVRGAYGICFDGDGSDFEYIIADDHVPGAAAPDGCVIREIPAGTWAVFPVHGPLPEALQTVNTRIWKEWLPNLTGYRLAGSYNIEYYPAVDDYSEIWVPVDRL